MKNRIPLLRRLSVGVIDQFVSSGANFLMTIYAARALPVEGFGALSVALVSVMFIVNLARGLCSEAMLIRPGETVDERRQRAGRAASSAFLVGMVAGAVFAGAGLLTSGPLSGCLFVLAVAMPFLLLQDTLRFAAFARADPGAALLSDSLWAVGQLLGFGAIALWAEPTAPLVLVAWTVPAALAAGVHLAYYRVVPAVASPVSWITENRDLSVVYAIDFLGNQGAAQLGVYALAAVAGVAEVAGLRGSHTLFGLLNVLSAGAMSVLVPEGRRLVARSMRALDRMCAVASAVFLAAAVVTTVGFLFVPDNVGEALLGSSWEPSQKLIVPTGLGMAGSGVLVGLRAGIRSMAGAAQLLRARVYTAPAAIGFPVVGAVWGGATGAALGIAASVWWNVGWYVRAYRQSADRYRAEQPSPDRLDAGGAAGLPG